jgi:hypothetical protein
VIVIDYRKGDGLGSAQKLLVLINGFEVLKLHESFHPPIINHPPPDLDALHAGKGWSLCMLPIF